MEMPTFLRAVTFGRTRPLAQIVLTSASTSTSTVGCTGAGCVYIGGGDITWFISANCVAKSYAGYCRPVFSGGGSPVATFPGESPLHFSICTAARPIPEQRRCHMIVDNLEFTGLNQANNTGTPALSLPSAAASLRNQKQLLPRMVA